MRILVLGGTVFLSRAVAVEAVRRGHDVTSACRGVSGSVPEGARWLRLDRERGFEPFEPVDEPFEPFETVASQPPQEPTVASQPPQRPTGEYDVAVDVAGSPSWVSDAVDRWPGAHWVYVSTINVYSDTSTSGGSPDTLPLVEPLAQDRDPMEGPEVYGAMKVACEQIVRAGAASSMVVRPGLIVGPGDPSGRFTYWPARLADVGPGEPVLAPGAPDDPVQVIDVRDLAAWIVDSAEQRRTGTFDGTGHVTTRQALLEEVGVGVGTVGGLVWVPTDFLAEHDVRPWSGPRSLPLWVPLPEYAGLMAHDAAPSFAAGLTTRPLADTTRDTLDWLRATPDATVTGLTRDEEAEVLRAWLSSDPA